MNSTGHKPTISWIKIKREIRREPLRIVARIRMLPRHALHLACPNFHYERTIGRHRRTHIGDQPEARKIAVYLIYPLNGLQESHIAAIKYILRSGYAPLVVSNLELSDEQRDRLLKWSWLLIERPNFGYDFGGYRDAILHLELEHRRVERLALFNDSCWFPVPAECDWLAKAEQLNQDMVGSMSSFHIPRRIGSSLEGFKWSYDPLVRKFCYCSYALLFSGRVAGDPAFTGFWRRLLLFDSREKHNVVRYGEIGLTRWITKRGYSHGSTVGIQDLDEELDGLTCLELRDVLKMTASPWLTEYVAMKARLLEDYEDSSTWKINAIRFILYLAYRGPPCYSLADYLNRRHDFGFLKKATARTNEDSVTIMKVVAQRLDNQCDFDLCREVAEVAGESGA